MARTVYLNCGGLGLRALVALFLLFQCARLEAQESGKGALLFESIPGAQFNLEGVIGDRLRANELQWLLTVPDSNPGMIQMFHQRDRQPAPQLVPWAGEFVGKYLISAIQALRLTTNPQLKETTRRVIAQLIASQADDGYLGPFPKAERLQGHWDLWGHYHCMWALLMWHELTEDAAALQSCRRAADLVCRTFLGTGRRVYDAGSHEMNMAIIHALGWLHRRTRDPRYLEMMREIEKDWERAGDYFRTGLAGQEFFQTPRPRWESLHDLQGLIELYRITGDERYATAFGHHWRSILRWDRRNTGGFSSGEQATGNPYAPTPIETCCTVAWMAMTLDQMRVSGDAMAADEFELSLFNSAAGSQHPSGRWCTYNTPMDGIREASAHTIVFQARAGTPELNCCSVNGPRGLTMLSEWAVMGSADGLVINYYGPGNFQGKLRDSTPVALKWVTDYPLSGKVELRIDPIAARQFTLRFRIPRWSEKASYAVNAQTPKPAEPGTYLELDRRWQPGDRVLLDFDFSLRAVPGAREAAGKVSVFRGPLLLAYDQRFNAFDEPDLPAIDLSKIKQASLVTADRSGESVLRPWLLLEVQGSNEQRVRLCDFASAGAAGTRYRSWLPASPFPPPPVVTRTPGDGTVIPRGPALFRWSGPRVTGSQVSAYRLVVARTSDFAKPIIDLPRLKSNRLALSETQMRALTPDYWYFWKVVSIGQGLTTESTGPAARFRIDPSLPPLTDDSFAAVPEAPDGRILAAPLRGGLAAASGQLRGEAKFKNAAGPNGDGDHAVALDGSQKIVYAVDEFPEENYSASVWVRIQRLPEARLGQILSAWAAPMDDPLRICIQDAKLYARIEAGQGYSTEGTPISAGTWHHIAAVKSGSDLVLYVDGHIRGRATVPLYIYSTAKDLALGGNPHFPGNEFLAADFSDLNFYSKALSAEEVAALGRASSSKAQ
ncbi:MAG: beta-L-arabinofuranosidase domain-containing protein [Verrucomicrobiota bacterium]